MADAARGARRCRCAAAVGTVAISAPYIRRWASAPPRPALKTIAFDYTTVDEKGARMPAERASASIFTETLGASVGLDMVSIPAGVFTMGSPKYEPERRANEGPQHSVTLGRFFIGAFPVTQAQWAAVVTAHPAKLAYGLDPYPSFFKGDDLPVESIAWNQADEFCRRLAEMTEARLSPAKRSRMGIFLPRRIDRPVQRRADDHNRSCELLRRGRGGLRQERLQERRLRRLLRRDLRLGRLRSRPRWDFSQNDDAARDVPAQRLRSL